jgi:hypothetical protein
MPIVDKFVTAMTTSNARELSIVAGECPAIYVRGKREPIMDHRSTAAQVRRLVSEIAGSTRIDELESRGSSRFEYRGSGGAAVVVEVRDWDGETHVQLSFAGAGEPDASSNAGPAFEQYAAIIAEVPQLRDMASRQEAELAEERAAVSARFKLQETALLQDWHGLHRVVQQVDASLLPVLAHDEPTDPTENWRDEFTGTVLDAPAFAGRLPGIAAFAQALRAREAAAQQLRQSLAIADKQYLAAALARMTQLDERLRRQSRDDNEQAMQGYQALAAELVAHLQRQALNGQLEQIAEAQRARAEERRRRHRILAAFAAAALLVIPVTIFQVIDAEQARVRSILEDATKSLDAERYQEVMDKLAPLADDWSSLSKTDLVTANRLCSAAADGVFGLAMSRERWAQAMSLAQGEGLPCPGGVDKGKLEQNILNTAVQMQTVPDALAAYVQDKLLAKKDRGRLESAALDRLIERRGGPIQVRGSASRDGVNKGFITNSHFTISVEATAAAWEPPNTVALTLKAELRGESDSAPVQCKPGLVKASTMLGSTPDCVFGRNRLRNGEPDVRVYRFNTALEPLLAPGWGLQMYTDWGQAMQISFSLYDPERPTMSREAAESQRQASSEPSGRR